MITNYIKTLTYNEKRKILKANGYYISRVSVHDDNDEYSKIKIATKTIEEVEKYDGKYIGNVKYIVGIDIVVEKIIRNKLMNFLSSPIV